MARAEHVTGNAVVFAIACGAGRNTLADCSLPIEGPLGQDRTGNWRPRSNLGTPASCRQRQFVGFARRNPPEFVCSRGFAARQVGRIISLKSCGGSANVGTLAARRLRIGAVHLYNVSRTHRGARHGKPHLVMRTDPTPAEIGFLEDRLYEFNAKATGIVDALSLAIFGRNEHGEVVAGLCGHTWGGCCEIRQVWVHERHRGRGVGRQLLKLAETEARRRSCFQIILATHSFQAPEFIES